MGHTVCKLHVRKLAAPVTFVDLCFVPCFAAGYAVASVDDTASADCAKEALECMKATINDAATPDNGTAVVDTTAAWDGHVSAGADPVCSAALWFWCMPSFLGMPARLYLRCFLLPRATAPTWLASLRAPPTAWLSAQQSTL